MLQKGYKTAVGEHNILGEILISLSKLSPLVLIGTPTRPATQLMGNKRGTVPVREGPAERPLSAVPSLDSTGERLTTSTQDLPPTIPKIQRPRGAVNFASDTKGEEVRFFKHAALSHAA